MMQVSLGMYTRNIDPEATYSTTPSFSATLSSPFSLSSASSTSLSLSSSSSSLSLSSSPSVPPQRHQREAGAAGLAVLRKLFQNSLHRPGHHRRRPELHPRQCRVPPLPVPHRHHGGPPGARQPRCATGPAFPCGCRDVTETLWCW